MHNPESILKSEMHKILWNFELQTDQLISAKRLDLVIVNKGLIDGLEDLEIRGPVETIQTTEYGEKSWWQTHTTKRGPGKKGKL